MCVLSNRHDRREGTDFISENGWGRRQGDKRGGRVWPPSPIIIERSGLRCVFHQERSTRSDWPGGNFVRACVEGTQKRGVGVRVAIISSLRHA